MRPSSGALESSVNGVGDRARRYRTAGRNRLGAQERMAETAELEAHDQYHGQFAAQGEVADRLLPREGHAPTARPFDDDHVAIGS